MKACGVVRGVRLSVLCLLLGVAQGATNDIHVMVSSVIDMRTTESTSPRCQVKLKFSGESASEAFVIRDIHITAATDDTGCDLLSKPQQLRIRARLPMGVPAKELTQIAEIASPARSARTIKLIEGEAELLMPTPDNGGLAIIQDFMAHPGEPLGDPVLKKSNVTLTYLGKESPGTNANQTAVGSGSWRRPSERYTVQFFVNDPNNRLADILFMDSYGRQVLAGSSSFGGGGRTYAFQNEPPPSLRLYVYLAAPDAIRTVPFKIENIALP